MHKDRASLFSTSLLSHSDLTLHWSRVWSDKHSICWPPKLPYNVKSSAPAGIQRARGRGHLGANRGLIHVDQPRGKTEAILANVPLISLTSLWFDERESRFHPSGNCIFFNIRVRDEDGAGLWGRVGETETYAVSCKSQRHIFTCFCSCCFKSYRFNICWRIGSEPAT